MRIPALVAILSATLVAALGTASAQHEGPHWSYEGKTGPVNWGKLNPDYHACADGKTQSPIDIRNAHLDKALQPIEFHYIGTPVTIVNNGHTIQVTPNPGSYIVADGVRYDLQQFHFHHPSEEAVHGKLSDMVVHLVHKSADGKLAVVAVRLNVDNAGDPNATLATLWEHLPTQHDQTEKISDMINPGGLLPGDRGYWAFLGSLTTPPCTEGVHWFVLEQQMSISRSQLQAFASLYRVNSRPLQDTHGRKIEANE
ncbi:MAG TPA: carbonic anhydrase family protein [Terracidiphilus sp.]|nr:carbonic anhydrase family protein [Terracidiphilus sp.]